MRFAVPVFMLFAAGVAPALLAQVPDDCPTVLIATARDRTTIECWMAGPGDDAPALSAAN